MTARRDTLSSLAWRVSLALGGTGLLLLLGLPLAALALRIPPTELIARLADPFVLDALRLSLLTSLCATVLVTLLGLPVAYLLATRDFPGKRCLEVLVDLPMVLPPTVSGLALLLALGRSGWAGRSLDAFGISLPFTTAAVVLAQAFMAAPFFVATVRAGFSSIDSRLIEAAVALRATDAYLFRRVMLPLALPSVLAGVVLAWARALGEFGATITFAGNLPGVTQTMPLAVYIAMQSDLEAAIVLSVLLLLGSGVLLYALRSALPLFQPGSGAGWLFGSANRKS